MAAPSESHQQGEAVRAIAERAGGPLAPAWVVAGSLLGILLLALVGWAAWTRGALVGLRWVEFDSPLTLAGFGFVAGLGAFFAPCAFSLFPGYISYYLAASTGNPERELLGRSLRLGLTCAAGSIAFFALVGAAITVIGGAVSPYLIATKPFIALGVVALGASLLADLRFPALPLPSGLRRNPGARLPLALGVFLYGFGYALASTGCTLPIYVSVTVLPLTSGYSGAAFVTFLSFALAMALMMLLTGALVGLAKRNLLSRLQASTLWIKRGSGVVLILAGLYLGYYYLKAGM